MEDKSSCVKDKDTLREPTVVSPYLAAVLDRILPVIPSKPRILDVGCGRDLRDLRILSRSGTMCVGIDVHSANDINSDRKGIEYIRADLDERTIPTCDSAFDLVVLNNIIEHFYHPKDLLEECRRVLRGSGVLVLHTPNQARLTNRIRLSLGRSVYYPLDYWLGAGNEHIQKRGRSVFAGHIREYTASEIKRMLSQVGFRILYITVLPAVSPSPRLGPSRVRLLRAAYNSLEILIPDFGYMIAVIAVKD